MPQGIEEGSEKSVQKRDMDGQDNRTMSELHRSSRYLVCFFFIKGECDDLGIESFARCHVWETL